MKICELPWLLYLLLHVFVGQALQESMTSSSCPKQCVKDGQTLLCTDITNNHMINLYNCVSDIPELKIIDIRSQISCDCGLLHLANHPNNRDLLVFAPTECPPQVAIKCGYSGYSKNYQDDLVEIAGKMFEGHDKDLDTKLDRHVESLVGLLDNIKDTRKRLQYLNAIFLNTKDAMWKIEIQAENDLKTTTTIGPPTSPEQEFVQIPRHSSDNNPFLSVYHNTHWSNDKTYVHTSHTKQELPPNYVNIPHHEKTWNPDYQVPKAPEVQFPDAQKIPVLEVSKKQNAMFKVSENELQKAKDRENHRHHTTHVPVNPTTKQGTQEHRNQISKTAEQIQYKKVYVHQPHTKQQVPPEMVHIPNADSQIPHNNQWPYNNPAVNQAHTRQMQAPPAYVHVPHHGIPASVLVPGKQFPVNFQKPPQPMQPSQTSLRTQWTPPRAGVWESLYDVMKSASPKTPVTHMPSAAAKKVYVHQPHTKQQVSPELVHIPNGETRLQQNNQWPYNNPVSNQAHAQQMQAPPVYVHVTHQGIPTAVPVPGKQGPANIQKPDQPQKPEKPVVLQATPRIAVWESVDDVITPTPKTKKKPKTPSSPPLRTATDRTHSKTTTSKSVDETTKATADETTATKTVTDTTTHLPTTENIEAEIEENDWKMKMIIFGCIIGFIALVITAILLIIRKDNKNTEVTLIKPAVRGDLDLKKYGYVSTWKKLKGKVQVDYYRREPVNTSAAQRPKLGEIVTQAISRLPKTEILQTSDNKGAAVSGMTAAVTQQPVLSPVQVSQKPKIDKTLDKLNKMKPVRPAGDTFQTRLLYRETKQQSQQKATKEQSILERAVPSPGLGTVIQDNQGTDEFHQHADEPSASANLHYDQKNSNSVQDSDRDSHHDHKHSPSASARHREHRTPQTQDPSHGHKHETHASDKGNSALSYDPRHTRRLHEHPSPPSTHSRKEHEASKQSHDSLYDPRHDHKHSTSASPRHRKDHKASKTAGDQHNDHKPSTSAVDPRHDYENSLTSPRNLTHHNRLTTAHLPPHHHQDTSLSVSDQNKYATSESAGEKGDDDSPQQVHVRKHHKTATPVRSPRKHETATPSHERREHKTSTPGSKSTEHNLSTPSSKQRENVPSTPSHEQKHHGPSTPRSERKQHGHSAHHETKHSESTPGSELRHERQHTRSSPASDRKKRETSTSKDDFQHVQVPFESTPVTDTGQSPHQTTPASAKSQQNDSSSSDGQIERDLFRKRYGRGVDGDVRGIVRVYEPTHTGKDLEVKKKLFVQRRKSTGGGYSDEENELEEFEALIKFRK